MTKKADKYLGGQSGEAAKAIRSRKSRLEQEEDKAMGKESPNKGKDTDSSKDRPKQSKKWYE